MKNQITHTLSILLLVTGLLLLPSCKSFVEDDEISPYAPQTVVPEALLSSIEVHVGNLYTGNLSRMTAIFMQSQTGMERQYRSLNRYQMLESDVEQEWVNAYEGALMDLKIMIAQADAEGKSQYAGVGKVLRAMTLGLVTDCWGDIPYSEALQGAARLGPAYDSQESIYRQIQADLDAAIVDLTAEVSNPNAPGAVPGLDDLIHRGDANNWLITAWTLKARYHNHLSKLDPAGSAELAVAAVNEALALGASPASDTKAKYGPDLTNRNQWALFIDQRFGDLGMGGYLSDTMWRSGDPRVYGYVFPNKGGRFVGNFPGDNFDQGDSLVTIGLAFSDVASSIPMVSFVELKFIEAEALLRLGDAAGAADAFNTAVEKSVYSYNAPLGEIDAYLGNYLADPTGEQLTLADVMYQKYVALFTQIESWTDYRRTGYPKFPLPEGLTDADFPRSFPTAQSETQRNPNAPNRRGVRNRVWWDIN